MPTNKRGEKLGMSLIKLLKLLDYQAYTDYIGWLYYAITSLNVSNSNKILMSVKYLLCVGSICNEINIV